jgi:alpha-tubulin suppressor-like RCC1 family protein
MMGCGRKHYIIVTKDNNLMAWGNVLKEKNNDPSQ